MHAMIDNSPANFDKILKITHALLQIQDIDALLERISTEIRSTIGADASSIYLVEGTTLKFSHTQNNTLQKKLPFGKKLIYSTFSIPINNSSIAGYVANTGVLVNIPDAYSIDDIQPYSFDKHFDETTGYRTQSILTVPIKSSSGKVTGAIQLINAFDHDQRPRPFTATEETIVQFFADNAAIAIEHAQTVRSMIMRMNKMVELHDHTETAAHNNRVAAYAVEIYEVWARKKGIPAREIQYNKDVLRMAAMLYDIGKIAIPTSILKKPYTERTPEELKIFQQHVIYGAMLFANSSSSFEEMAKMIALNHHERWDGSGYPGHIQIDDGRPLPGYQKADGSAYGKSGEAIPIYARIIALASTYDDLVHDRTTTTINDEKLAIDKILADSGKQFDPEVVAAFISCLEVINSISIRYTDTKSHI